MRPLLAVLALAALAVAAPASGRVDARASTTKLVVGFVDGLSAGQQDAVLAAAGATRTASMAPIDAVAATGPAAALTALSRDARVRYARVDAATRRLAAPPTDVGYTADTWAYDATTTGLASVWEIERGDSGALIAVLDTGIDAGHPDFAGKVAAGYDFINEDTDPDDDEGHGTAVAGAAAARIDGAAGVGACPDCSILPIKVFDAGGNTTSSAIARGLLWAVEKGADVINLSYGGPVEDPIETDAVAYAVARGVVVVAAVGNLGADGAYYPARLPGVVGVAAIDDFESTTALASWSNYGAGVDLAAPGRLTLTRDGGGSASVAGTSFAAPLVAGTAALLLASELSPSPGAVLSALSAGDGVVAGLPDNPPGSGTNFAEYEKFDAWSVFASLAPVDPPALTTPFVSLFGAARVGQTLWARTGQWSPQPTSFAYQWSRCDTIGAGCADVAGATSAWYALTGDDLGKTLRVRVTASNAAGSSSGTSMPSAVVKAASDAPVPTSPATLSGLARAGSTLTVSPGTWKGASPAFTYRWQRCDASASACYDQAATGTTYALTDDDSGKRIRVVVTAANADGSESSDVYSDVVERTAPATPGLPDLTVSLSASSTRPASGGSVTLTARATARPGSATAERATLTLLLPDVLVWDTVRASKGYCLAFGNRVDCEVGPLAAGQSADLTLVAAVHGDGSLVVKARASAGSAETATSDNEASVALSVGDSTQVRAASAATARVLGAAKVGRTLRATSAGLTAARYQWQLCRARCAAIRGATKPAIVVRGTWAGARLRVVVRSGSARRLSALTAPVRR